MTNAQSEATPQIMPAGTSQDTGQYTISVSKKGTGEEHEDDCRFDLKVTMTSSANVPKKCIATLVEGSYDRDNTFQIATFGPSGEASVALTASTPLQPGWWVDIALLYGENNDDSETPVYVLSAYLSSLTSTATITYTYALLQRH